MYICIYVGVYVIYMYCLLISLVYDVVAETIAAKAATAKKRLHIQPTPPQKSALLYIWM